MLAILPFVCLILLILCIRNYNWFHWRGSFLFGVVIWGGLITAITEFLSLFDSLDFWSVLSAWMVIFAILVYLLFFRNRARLSSKLTDIHKLLQPIEIYLGALIMFIVIVVGITALVYPPNTWDSMTYHMSRIAHWIQNRSLNFYPTVNLRQLYLNPWAEYAILHLLILENSDLFANSIQWLAMVGNIIGVSLIARELGASTRGQFLSGFISVTIPMGILQGSSTQTDAIVSFWLVCFVYFAMLLRKEVNLLFIIGVGLSLGLSLLTKATAYVYAFPFLVWLVVSIFKKKVPRKWLAVALIAIISIIINFGHFSRNYDLFKNPLSPNKNELYYNVANDVFSFSSVSSNIIRNIGLHLTTPFPQINGFLEHAINYSHKILNISANDVRTTWPGTTFGVGRLAYNEDTAGNPWHLILFGFSILVFIFQKPRNGMIGLFFLLVAMGFILFSSYLRWQPWNSRLHLPLFILISPGIGLILTRALCGKAIILVSIIFFCLSLPYLFINQSRPLAGRDLVMVFRSRYEQYFNSNPQLYDGYFSAGQILSDHGCSKVGIIIGPDDFEYPIWMIINNNKEQAVVIEHVNVTNVSKSIKTFESQISYCALFTINSDPPERILVNSKAFSIFWTDELVNIYLPP